MTLDRPCSWPDRAQLALLDSTGRLDGPDRARWDAHLQSCPSCAREAGEDARWDEALRREAARGGRAASPGRRTRALVWGMAAGVVVATGLWAMAHRGSDGAAEWEARYRTALRHSGEGRPDEALAIAEALLEQRREYSVLFLSGHALLNSGRASEAAARFREALAVGASASPTGEMTPLWYVHGHLAQALLGAASGAESDAEVERILRDEMSVSGRDASRNRCLLWAELARLRTFVRGDLAGGAAALAALERENVVHRAESQKAGVPDLDCHYALHMRFAYAQVVRADSAEGRRIAKEIRDVKTLTSRTAATPSSRDSYVADGLETEVRAELLAERRGDPADLGHARRLAREARRLREASGNPQGLSRVLGLEAWIDLLGGRADAALSSAEEAARTARESGAPSELAEAHLLRAQALVALGRKRDALGALAEVARVPGGSDDSRALALASVEWAASEDPGVRTSARARLEGAATSPLADVRQVALRTLRVLGAGQAPMYGPRDFGLDVRP